MYEHSLQVIQWLCSAGACVVLVLGGVGIALTRFSSLQSRREEEGRR